MRAALRCKAEGARTADRLPHLSAPQSTVAQTAIHSFDPKMIESLQCRPPLIPTPPSAS